MLTGRALSSGEIADQFEISAPAISQHLKILKRAQFVRSRTEGQRRIYELDPSGFDELENWLMAVKRFWLGRLDRLNRDLDVAAGEVKNKRKRRRKGNPT